MLLQVRPRVLVVDDEPGVRRALQRGLTAEGMDIVVAADGPSALQVARTGSFDAILLVILASVLSRGINGSAGFFTTIGLGFVLVLLHRFFGWIACRSHAFGMLIKGSPIVIIRDGEINHHAMRQNLISHHDLEEDLRLDAETEDISKIKIARLERSGDISFIKSS